MGGRISPDPEMVARSPGSLDTLPAARRIFFLGKQCSNILNTKRESVMKKYGFGRWLHAALAAIGLLALAAVASAQSVVVYSAVSPKVMSAFVEEFQKQNPGVKVELISGGS